MKIITFEFVIFYFRAFALVQMPVNYNWNNNKGEFFSALPPNTESSSTLQDVTCKRVNK